jgi:hypothetical protein
LLLGCHNGDGDGGFGVNALVNSETVVMDIDASHATWIDQGRALFVDERGVLRLVDFSGEDPEISVVGDLGRPVTAIDFDAGTSRLAVLLGDDNESASSAIHLVDMKGKVLGKIDLSENVSAIFWRGSGRIEVETRQEWLVVDVESGKVSSRRDRRGCSMAAATADSYVSWCPQSGELVQHRDGGTKRTITTISDDDLDWYFIGVAEAVLDHS